MAEVLGCAASVLTIVETIAYITKYIRSCKHAPQESQHLVRELSYVRGLLITLQETIDEQESSDDTWCSTGVLLNDGNGLLPQFQQLLDVLDLRIGGPFREKGLKKLTHALKWPFKESETLKLLNTIERYKSLFELALENNHIRFSKAIHNDVKLLSVTVQGMKDELSLCSQDVKAIDVRSQHVHEEVIESTQQLKLLNLNNEDSEFRKVFKWLSTWNFWSRQQDILTQRVGETCAWFLETPEFIQWKSDTARFLHCYGPPGIGKTVLTSVIVHHLQSAIPLESRVVAFFCDNTTKSGYTTLLGALLQQLTQDKCSDWNGMKALYEQHIHGTKPQSGELLALLRNELKTARQVYIILDALDEWSTDSGELFLWLSDLKDLGSNVNILVTSRPAIHIPSLFADSARLEISPPASDLRSYMRLRIGKESDRNERGFLKHDFQLQEKVENTLLERCEGLFLLARLQLDQLSRQRHKRAFMKALESLPRTPDELYNAALKRIESQSREDATLAQRTFAWVYHSREHPSINLLQVALAIEPGDNIINEDGYVDWEILTSICGGLIVMDQESQIVRFVHPTTRTYFEQYFGRQPHSLESNLTVSCLTFILSDTFKDLMADLTQLPSQSLDERDTRRSDNYLLPTFLIYAVRNVTAHYCSHEDTQECFNLMKDVFNNNQVLTLFWWARVRFSFSACGWKLPKISDSDKLCIASFLGLSNIVEWLLESEISPNDHDTTGQTPLYAAASRSENRVIKILVRHGADPSEASFDTPKSLRIDSNAQPLCYTPMHCALVRGNIELVQTLERHGVVMGPSWYASQSITPLRMAIQSKSKPTLEYVLRKHQQDLHHDKLTLYSPLHDAIEGGSLEVLSLLLEAGASGSTLDNRERLPIKAAIRAPSWRVPDATCSLMCRMLIKHEPSMKSFLESEKFQLYRPALWAQRPQTLGMLLERHWSNGYNNPDSLLGGLWKCLNENSFNAANHYIGELDPKTIIATELEDSNALFYAIYRGWESTVIAILQLADTLHCNVSLKNRALCEAIQGYNFTIVDILLDAGADINAALSTGTPLCRAVLSQGSRLVEHLLLRGANPNTECVRYDTAMHALVDEQFTPPTHYTTKILRLLFQHGADVNTVSKHDGTVLTAMAKMSTKESLQGVRYLLSLGVDCNKTGGFLFTPMIVAARSPNNYSLEAMQALREAGVDVNAFGGFHGTALLAALRAGSFCGAEKILKLVEWGADVHAVGTFGTFTSMAVAHTDEIIRNLALDNHKLLRHYMLHKDLVTAALSDGIEAMIELLKTSSDFDLNKESFENLPTPGTTLSAETVSELPKIQLLLAHSAMLDAPALQYSNVLQLYLDRKVPYIPALEYLFKSGVSADALIGLYRNRSVSDIVAWYCAENSVSTQKTWKKVVSLISVQECS